MVTRPPLSLPLCPPPRSMMEYSLDGHNVSLSAIRTVRVLRPLRAINRVPSKRPPSPRLGAGVYILPPLLGALRAC